MTARRPGPPAPRLRGADRLLAGVIAGLLTAAAPAGSKPPLMMMSGLPIVWGEKGAFDPEARPARIYQALQREFEIRLLDTLEPKDLEKGRLLLLAQPQRLSPVELTAVDEWVRLGGRILILADPNLAWPSELPLGDIRRPPRDTLLRPLLTHWGVELEEAEPGLREQRLLNRRIALEGPGRFTGGREACTIEPEWLARCRIGPGRAIIVADADLFRDALWAPESAERPSSDNALAVADWLDELAGLKRQRSLPGSSAGASRIVPAGLLPLLALAGAGLWWRCRARRSPTRLSTGSREANDP